MSSKSNSITDADFDSSMAALGPFEAAPHLAVAVSGGGDSMALALLAERWVHRRGGRLTALTVDHGLRVGSANEAAQVGRWMAALGIEHRVLPWSGPKPTSGIQAAARAARYELMENWARRAGVLHLLLAHNREDQAETFLMRLSRGSGIDGLSAMAAIFERSHVRLVRPLLGHPRADLRATLTEVGQEWIEDPSNKDTAFARTRVRNQWPLMIDAGLTPERLAQTAAGLGQARVTMESAVSSLLAATCTIHPAGYAVIKGNFLSGVEPDLTMRALARIILCIGGGSYAPRLGKLERLYAHLADPDLRDSLAGRTLGGCRILCQKNGQEDGQKNGQEDGLMICRENRIGPDPMAVAPGQRILWDRRFVVDLAAGGGTGSVDLVRLTPDGWAEIAAEQKNLRQTPLPAPVRLTVPALRDKYGVLAVPHLGYIRRHGEKPSVRIKGLVFSPPNSAAGVGFHVA